MPLKPPYPRESGRLVRVDDAGRELRLHVDGSGLFVALEWRYDPEGEPICAHRFSFSRDELLALAETVSDDLPLAEIDRQRGDVVSDDAGGIEGGFRKVAE